MPANSTILIPSTSHAANLDPENITGEKFKGAGFYGMGCGLHTVSYQITTFTGDIKAQATLATDPQEEDWFDVSGSEYTGTAATEVYITNFTGNFVWLRAVVNYTAGTVNRILVNY
jgi:hypothetical protein